MVRETFSVAGGRGPGASVCVCVTQILHIKGLVSAEDIWQDEPEDQVNSAYVKTWVIVAVTA